MTNAIRTPDTGGDRHELLAEIVSLYYNDGLDQREIAARIGLSRSTVSRMITEARELGIVEIRINRPLPTDESLRQEAIERYSLRDALILSTEDIQGDVLRRVGSLAAHYVEATLSDQSTLAISWGTSLAAAAEALTPGQRRGTRVVQMIGAAGSLQPDVDGAELARNMAHKLGGTSISLNAPLIVDDPALASALVRQESVASVLDMAAAAELALIGLGGMHLEISSLVRAGFATKADLDAAAESGVVGDAGGHMLTADGTTAHSELSRRIVGLDEPRLRAIPTVVAIAVGLAKVDIIHAALLSGIVDVIASDASTMRSVLELARRRGA